MNDAIKQIFSIIKFVSFWVLCMFVGRLFVVFIWPLLGFQVEHWDVAVLVGCAVFFVILGLALAVPLVVDWANRNSRV